MYIKKYIGPTSSSGVYIGLEATYFHDFKKVLPQLQIQKVLGLCELHYYDFYYCHLSEHSLKLYFALAILDTV